MSPIPNFIGILVYTIIQFIVFIFVVIATPLPMFRSKASLYGIHSCETLWGATTKCNGSKYSSRKWACSRRDSTMKCGAAFSIISIVFTLVAFILGLMMVFKYRCPVFVPLIFTVLSVIFILICWACVAGVMTEKMCSTKYSSSANYGAGFGLMVTAWCLEVVDFVLLVVLACL